ncbi:MAG: hypothetical protein ACJAUV_000668 [Flavobacteriales bacterium]|jgi:hypothetical protein
MRKLLLIVVCFLAICSCKKKEDSGTSPMITIESIYPLEVVEFKDSIIINLSYCDLDGDLGRQDPDNNSLWIKDERVPEGETYHLPPITEENKNNTTGTIRVYIPSLFLFGNGDQEVTKLTLKIQDQSGNWSEAIVTPQIIVNK